MTLSFDPMLPAACAAVFTTFLCMLGAQEPGPDPSRALFEQVDRHRVPASQLAGSTLLVEGSYAVTFESMPEQKVSGRFRELFSGRDLARHTSDMGNFGKMERGLYRDIAWEVDPTMGAKVHRGPHDAVVRRYFAWLRGAPVGALYASANRTGTETVDGRECAVWRLEPKAGSPDVAYVAEDGTVPRVDIALPAPESADATWDLGDEMPAQITFGDWTEVDGARIARRRVLRMGPATVTFECAKVQAGVKIAPEDFAPPPAVEKARQAPAAGPAFGPDGQPLYQIVDRTEQPVVTIRVTCKTTEISEQLATILPEVMAHITAVGGKIVGPPFSRYHSFGEEVDLEAGMAVQEPVPAKGRIGNGELPAGRAVTVWHVGPYDELGDAHAGLQQHITANGLRVRGAVWEVYWTDPGMVTDPAKWRTQLFQPIE